MATTTGRAESPMGAASSPMAEEDLVCPTCAWLLRDPTAQTFRQPVERPWWPWAPVVVGVYLIVVFGLSAWHASQRLTTSDQALRDAGLAPTQTVNVQNPQELIRVKTLTPVLETYLLARRDLSRDLPLVVTGVTFLLLGLGALARRHLQRTTNSQSWLAAGVSPRPDPASLPAAVRGAWAFAEDLSLSFSRLFLAVYGYLVVAQLVAGVPPSWDLVDQTLREASDLLAAIVQVVKDA